MIADLTPRQGTDPAEATKIAKAEQELRERGEMVEVAKGMTDFLGADHTTLAGKVVAIQEAMGQIGHAFGGALALVIEVAEVLRWVGRIAAVLSL